MSQTALVTARERLVGTHKILLSLLTSENDYQKEQAEAAQQAAERLGVQLDVVYAENDPVQQSQQVLAAIQSKNSKPDGIAAFPASPTGLGQVAKAAVGAGIGWAVLNRKVDYLASLRASCSVPVFQVSTDHVEIGRIQGRQAAVLMPEGGLALYIQGPASASAAEDRAAGFNQTKPANLQLRSMRANWTQESAYAAVEGWLRLSIAHTTPVCAVIAHNDAMAMGARRALEEGTTGKEQERWLGLPFLGCDGLQRTGRVWVKNNLLRATVIHPLTAGLAIEIMANSLRTGSESKEATVLEPASYPPIESLRVGTKSRSLAD
jgi:ABC-type sugar transport system substrate-binding protein